MPAEISPADAHAALLAGTAVLVDVRERDEHRREHIAGAKLVPLSSFDPARVPALVRRGQSLILHCRSGRRSADASRLCAALASEGVGVLSLAGGIEGWKAAGLPVVASSAAPQISIMRQVQLVVGLLVLLGSGLAWFVDPAFIGIAAFLGAGLTFAGATGTCALASLLGAMPWNRPGAAPCASAPSDCCSGR